MKHLFPLIAVGLVALTFLSPVAVRGQSGPVATAMKAATSKDRATVGGIYAALAEITERDGGKQITSLSVWRTCHSSTLRLAAGGTDLVGKYPGLDRAVEEVLGTFVSLDDLPMTPELAGKLAAGCREVAKQSGR